MKHWKRIIAWVGLLTMVGCSVAIIGITRPQKKIEIGIDVDIQSKIDSTAVEVLDVDLLKSKSKNKESVVVDSTDSIK